MKTVKCIFFLLKRTTSTLQLKQLICDTLFLTCAGVLVVASGFHCECLLPNKKQKLEEAWVLLPQFTAILVMFDYKKLPNLGPGHCLGSNWLCFHLFLISALSNQIWFAVFRGPRQSFARCSQRRSASTGQNSA